MRGLKYKLLGTVFGLTLLLGIFAVNMEFYKSSGREADVAAISLGDNQGAAIVKPDLYSELPSIFGGTGRLQLYLKFEPFDLRLSNGKYIFYINREAADNIKERKDKLINNVNSSMATAGARIAYRANSAVQFIKNCFLIDGKHVETK